MPFNYKKGYEPPASGRGSKLTAKQRRFVESYVLQHDKFQALEDAGYKTKNKKEMARALMAHPLVSKAIEEATEAKRVRNELSQDYVIQKLIDIVEDTETGNPQAALRGLELLGKHLGLYKERQEISGPDGEAIRMEQKVKQDAADFSSRLSRLSRRNSEDGVAEFPKPGSASGT